MSDQPQPQTNEFGQVALKHFTSNPATIQVGPEKVPYSFVPKFNVSLAWVAPEHVNSILSIQARICCGHTKQKFQYANALDVCLWSTGERC